MNLGENALYAALPDAVMTFLYQMASQPQMSPLCVIREPLTHPLLYVEFEMWPLQLSAPTHKLHTHTHTHTRTHAITALQLLKLLTSPKTSSRQTFSITREL